MSARKSRLCHSLQIAAHRLRKAADRAVSEAGVTTAQAAVLAIVARQGAATQREVARLLAVNESAVTTMVGRLAEAGLISRMRDGADARAWRLALTAAGGEALRRAEDGFGPINAAIESALAPEGVAQLAGLLDRLGEAFAQAAEDDRDGGRDPLTR